MIENFKKELKGLLKKYDATIGFDCSPFSDTYGLYGDCITIDIKGKTEFKSSGCWISSADLEEEI